MQHPNQDLYKIEWSITRVILEICDYRIWERQRTTMNIKIAISLSNLQVEIKPTILLQIFGLCLCTSPSLFLLVFHCLLVCILMILCVLYIVNAFLFGPWYWNSMILTQDVVVLNPWKFSSPHKRRWNSIITVRFEVFLEF